VTAGKAYGRSRSSSSVVEASNEESYRLVALEHAHAPEGHTGRDWLIYRIAQGNNVITGYRRGDLRAATADVERIVAGLNERRIASKGRPGPKPKTSAGAAAAPASPPDADDGAT
jgi:hypothetical protein